MRNYNDESPLEMVEAYADECGYIASEEELSERFDDEVLPLILEARGQPGVEFTDTVMVNEEFSNWTDGLAEEGEIHPIQVNQYCYVGELA